MWKVTYTLYGRYHKEKTFDSPDQARGFFYGYCVRTKGVSRAEMKEI